MRVDEILEVAGFSGGVRSERAMSGDSNARVRDIELVDGRRVVVKTIDHRSVPVPAHRAPDGGATRIDEEAMGLELLASTGTVPVPAVLGRGVLEGVAFLVLERLQVADDATVDDVTWSDFGRRLAALHLARPPVRADRFGLDHDNHLGDTPQDNRPMAEWVDFLRERRLRPMVERLRDRGSLTVGESKEFDRLLEAMSDMLPAAIRPGLIHGDLWGGNALMTADRGVTVIDPAVVIADPLFEIGMMRLFGGFPRACEESLLARLRAVGGPAMLEDSEARIEFGRLYHLLNHWLLFGRSYTTATMRSVANLAT